MDAVLCMWSEAYNRMHALFSVQLWAQVTEKGYLSQGLVTWGGSLALECLVSPLGCHFVVSKSKLSASLH